MRLKTSITLPPVRVGTAEQVQTVMIALIMFAFFRPAHYITGAAINKVWQLYTMAVSAVGVLYFMYKKKGRFQTRDAAVLFIALGYVFCFLIATLFNFRNGYFSGAIQKTLEPIGFLCVCCAGILYHTRPFFKGFLLTGLFWTVLHLITILLYQDGGMRKGRSMEMARDYSENYYLLTHANASYFIILAVMAVFFFYAYAYKPKWKIFAWLYLLFALFCFFTQWSVSGLVGFAVFTFFMVIEALTAKTEISGVKLRKRQSHLKLYMALCAVFNVLLTYGKLLEGSLELFHKYFNKLHSLKARVVIWEKCIELLKSPRILFGYGWEVQEATIAKTTYNHMHNILLEILYRGGLIGLVLLGAGLWMAFFYQHPARYQRTAGYRILTYVAVAYLVSSSFDFYLYHYEILAVFAIVLYYEAIQKDLKLQKWTGSE